MAPFDARGGLQGTFLHDGLPCRVLFDSGASHSFISRQFCLSRGLVVSAVSQQISVGTPTGVSVDLPEMVRRYEIRFMGRVFVVDMFVLGFEGFDVILGMNWLVRHYVSLDCGRRRVVLSEPGTERLVHERETPGDSVMISFLYILDFVSVWKM